jgi:hypothetical protein
MMGCMKRDDQGEAGRGRRPDIGLLDLQQLSLCAQFLPNVVSRSFDAD